MTEKTKKPQKPDRVRLAALLAGERQALRVGSGFSVASSLLWPLQAALIAAPLAGLVTGDVVWLSPLQTAFGFVALAILRAAFSHQAEGILFRAADRIVAQTRAQIITREARAATPSTLGGPGAMTALAREKLDALIPYITRYSPAQARVSVVTLVILVLAFSQSWAVGLVLIVAGPLIPVFMALIGRAAQEASAKQLTQIGTLNDRLVDRLAAMADIRILNAGDRVAADFAGTADGLRVRTMAVLRVAFLSSTVLELFAALGVAMVAVWVGFSLLDVVNWGTWGQGITPFPGMFLLLLIPDYFQPLRDLAAAYHDRAGALAVAGELVIWEEEARASILGTGDAAEPLPAPATIGFKALSAVRGDHRIIYPDATITPGERIAITGPSGAGKSTLLRLLAGLDRSDTGAITVADQPLDDTTADAWRDRIGWMPQAPHFLDMSLADNIGFGEDVTPDTIKSAVLEDVIARLPDGLNTRLGETGAGLSGGEGRRVLLARLIHAAPDVVLADEPTADLDDVTADRVIAGLMTLAGRGATLIVATHDPRLIAQMDRSIEVGA